ncbi:MAG TPA: membrane dipeptidase, partial [Pirellulaceae bacterium]|nr:membrane dipeptidase [Pirellulaceae bacterium]
AICDHPRNVPDDVLLRLPDNGGVVMVNFMSGYIVPTEQLAADRQAHGTFRDVVDHIEHVIRVAGIDHVGIGSDYDGVSRLPIGLEDVSCYPRLTEELLRRGYERDHIHQVLGGNVLRVMKIAERVADELREAQQHVQEFGR